VPGGIETEIPVETWPHDDNVHWLIAWDAQSERSDISCFRQFDMPFADLIASSDLVVTKPGYGMAAESVCNGKPVLYVKRGDWPEEPSIVAWMESMGNAAEISRQAFFYGEIQPWLNPDFLTRQKPVVAPTGIDQAADQLLSYF